MKINGDVEIFVPVIACSRLRSRIAVGSNIHPTKNPIINPIGNPISVSITAWRLTIFLI